MARGRIAEWVESQTESGLRMIRILVGERDLEIFVVSFVASFVEIWSIVELR